MSVLSICGGKQNLGGMEQLMACVRTFTLLLILLNLWVPCVVVGETNPNVLVATLSYIPGAPSLYVLYLPVGSPAQKLPLLLDLQGSATSLTCSRTSATNSSATSFFNPSVSSTFHNLSADTGGAGAACTSAEDGVSSLYIQRTAFGDPVLSANVSGVDFQCCNVPSPYAGVAGVAGFSTGSLSLPSQISKNAGLARQFASCLPSIMFFGRATTYAYLNPFPGQIVTFTPEQRTRLYYIKNPNPLASSGSGSGAGYAISLQSIGVGGYAATVLQKPIKLRISTTEAFTKLERSLYKAVRAQFRQAIGYGSTVKKMRAVPPFDTCFDSTPLYYAAQGPHLKAPAMALNLEGGVTWNLFPHNTFIVYNSTVTCLAFLNAGAGRPSVLGTFQQIDALLEFDLQHSQFAFKSLFDPFTIHPETPGCADVFYPLHYNPQ